MPDLWHATRYIRTSSNPMGGILFKVFIHLNFWGCISSCAFYHFCVLFVCFFCCFFVVFFVLFFFFCIVFLG